MTGLPFLTEADRNSLQELRKAEPPDVSLAFVTFALALDKKPERDFRASDLRGRMLYGQNLGGVDLRGADLRGADLRQAHNFERKDVLMEGALIDGDRWAPVDSAERWLSRWAILLEDEKYRVLLKEIEDVLEGIGRDWPAWDIAAARRHLRSAGRGSKPAAEEPPPINTEQVFASTRRLFSFHPRFGRQDD